MTTLERTALVATLALGGCISVASTTARPVPGRPATPASTATRQLPNDVKWFRTAAEYRALAEQTYAVAAEHLPALTRGMSARSWGVILDADETVLDNSEYERRRAVLDSEYTAPTWDAWVNERAATAIPGAVAFTRRVHDMGGRVVIVTNRTMNQCDATRANLISVGITTDAVVCQPQGESDKNPRFARVQNGSAVPGMPALQIIEWLGDNILDFPHLSQASRNDPAALAEFGSRYFILPNPMYGSWQ